MASAPNMQPPRPTSLLANPTVARARAERALEEAEARLVAVETVRCGQVERRNEIDRLLRAADHPGVCDRLLLELQAVESVSDDLRRLCASRRLEITELRSRETC